MWKEFADLTDTLLSNSINIHTYIDSLIVTRSHPHIMICPDFFYVAIRKQTGAVKMESSAFGKVGVENYPQWAFNCQDPE